MNTNTTYSIHVYEEIFMHACRNKFFSISTIIHVFHARNKLYYIFAMSLLMILIIVVKSSIMACKGVVNLYLI